MKCIPTGDTELLVGTSASKPTVWLLQEKLQRVQDRWYSIGLQLRLEPATLDTIRHDNNADCEMCMIATSKKWLAINCEACWQDVVDALIRTGHKVLAEEIKREYCACI